VRLLEDDEDLAVIECSVSEIRDNKMFCWCKSLHLINILCQAKLYRVP